MEFTLCNELLPQISVDVLCPHDNSQEDIKIHLKPRKLVEDMTVCMWVFMEEK